MFDYNEYTQKADVTSAKGIGEFLSIALTDWNNDKLTDLQFGDVVHFAIEKLITYQGK